MGEKGIVDQPMTGQPMSAGGGAGAVGGAVGGATQAAPPKPPTNGGTAPVAPGPGSDAPTFRPVGTEGGPAMPAAPAKRPPDPVATHQAIDALVASILDGSFVGTAADAMDRLSALKDDLTNLGGGGAEPGSAAAADAAAIDKAAARAKVWAMSAVPSPDFISPDEATKFQADQHLPTDGDAYKTAKAAWEAKAREIQGLADEAKSVAGPGAAPEVKEFAAGAQARADAMAKAVGAAFK